jgi:hypothetical protein
LSFTGILRSSEACGKASPDGFEKDRRPVMRPEHDCTQKRNRNYRARQQQRPRHCWRTGCDGLGHRQSSG